MAMQRGLMYEKDKCQERSANLIVHCRRNTRVYLLHPAFTLSSPSFPPLEPFRSTATNCFTWWWAVQHGGLNPENLHTAPVRPHSETHSDNVGLGHVITKYSHFANTNHLHLVMFLMFIRLGFDHSHIAIALEVGRTLLLWKPSYGSNADLVTSYPLQWAYISISHVEARKLILIYCETLSGSLVLQAMQAAVQRTALDPYGRVDRSPGMAPNGTWHLTVHGAINGKQFWIQTFLSQQHFKPARMHAPRGLLSQSSREYLGNAAASTKNNSRSAPLTSAETQNIAKHWIIIN